MPQPAIEHMKRTPTIVLDPKVTHTSKLARVHITTAATGISAPGTVYRMDEIPLPLRWLKSPYPTDEDVLKRIVAAVRKKPAWQAEGEERGADRVRAIPTTPSTIHRSEGHAHLRKVCPRTHAGYGNRTRCTG